MDLIVTIGGILYGLMLMLASFVRNGLTEAIRIDALENRQFKADVADSVAARCKAGDPR